MRKIALVMVLVMGTAFGCTTATETRSKLQADSAAVDALVRMYEPLPDDVMPNSYTEMANREIFTALTRIGEPAVPWLVGKLRHGNTQERHQALTAFYQMGPAAKTAVPALIEATRIAANGEFKWFIARALGSIQRRATKK